MPDDTNLVTAPSVNATGAVPAAAPGQAPVTAPPMLVPPPGFNPAPVPSWYDPAQWQHRMMSEYLSHYPQQQQERAIAAAQTFMAQQQMEKEIAAGVPRADAVAKAVSSLIFRPGTQITPGNSAALIRAMRPQTFKPPPTNPVDVAKARGLIAQIGKAQDDLDLVPTGKTADDNRNKLRYLEGQLEGIRARYDTPSGQTIAAPRAAPISGSRPSPTAQPPTSRPATVIRYNRDGRAVVYDAATKKPIRYAD